MVRWTGQSSHSSIPIEEEESTSLVGPDEGVTRPVHLQGSPGPASIHTTHFAPCTKREVIVACPHTRHAVM